MNFITERIKPMRRFAMLLLIPVLLLSMSLTLGQASDDTFPLQVLETNPVAGTEIGLSSPITFYLDRAADCDTAQTALTVQPAVAGEVTCANGSIMFTPTESYARATAYTFTLGEALRAEDGGALAESFSLALNTLGFLMVADTLPGDGALDVSPDGTVTVIFNRPVVPLGAIEDMDALPSPITLEPSVEGSGLWINTSIYQFTPSEPLAGGTDYTVTVNEGLTAMDGATMPEPYAFTFGTELPRVDQVSPSGEQVELGRTVQVRFNMPVDQARAESAFSLRPHDLTSADDTKVTGTFEWSDDGAGFRFIPDEDLTIATSYAAEIQSNVVTSSGGGRPMPVGETWIFETVPLPTILSTFAGFETGTEGLIEPYGSFTIYFASPMDIETLEDRVIVSPEPEIEYDSYYSEWDYSYTLSFNRAPRTLYTITMLAGMRDIYGNEIAEETVVEFTTDDYIPEMTLQVPSSQGFYNASNEATQLFLRYINISRAILDLYQVPLADYLAAYVPPDYDGYTPLSSEELGVDNLLRHWEIESPAPPNYIRYELLNLNGASDATDCPLAPASRLNVGDTAVVITDPDPLRVRAFPVDGEIVELMYRDAGLNIIGGPVCANDLLWWEVALPESRTGWVAEGTPDEYFLDVGTDVPAPIASNELSGTGPLPPGIYFLTATSPETAISQPYSNPQTHVIINATTNLTLYSSPDSVMVWVTDVQTGLPLANQPITIYDGESAEIAQGITGEDGVLSLELPRSEYTSAQRVAVLDTDEHFGMGYSEWQDGIGGWAFGVPISYYPEPYRAYLYTDRPIYRPDQPVYFRGIVRAKDDMTYTPPDVDSIPVQIFNDQGEVVFDQVLPLTEYGTFSGTFDLSESASLGYYRIVAQMPNQDSMDQWSGQQVTFGVAEYRAPEFQVSVTPLETEVAQNETIELTIDSRYFFGGAVSGGTVEYSVIAQPYYFRYEGDGWYSFEDYDSDYGSGEYYYNPTSEIASGSGTLDDQGRLTIEVPAVLEDSAQSQTFTIEATVSDESGFAVSGRSDVVVHKGEVYAGVAPDSYVGRAGEEALVNLIAVDWESQPVANQTLTVEVVERRWSSVQEQDDSGRTVWTYEVEDIPVTEGEVSTGSDGTATFSFAPPDGGTYKIKVTTRDEAGNEVAASAYLWVSSNQYVTWRQQNSNRIDLVADASDYDVGDTAQILITSPFQGASEALIVVARGDVLEFERITMDSNSYLYELPILPEYSPNIFVSAFIVHGVDETNPIAGFRYGLIQLNVGTDQRVITLDLQSDTEQAGPGDTVTYTVTATDYAGAPVQAEVGVSMSDLATLTIAPPNTGTLLDYFYSEQALDVITSSPLTINADQTTQTILDTIKGGDGGFGEGGIFDIRQEFVDTPYWNAELVTGEDGTATFSVTLPDNLTTWRVDARAITSGLERDMLVGQTTTDFLSTMPMLIRPVTPRFFIVDDEVVLAAIVNNNTPDDLIAAVGLEANGVTPLEGVALEQQVAIEAGTRQRVEWRVSVDDVNAVDLTFYASGNDGAYTDASKPPLGQGDLRLLPVYRYEVEETTGTAGVVNAGEIITEAILLPQTFDVTGGNLTVNIDHSLAATTLDGLEYLKNYPHQCIEQTISRFLPNIMTYRALATFDVADPELESGLNDAVNQALQRLYAEQKLDGGWGWFIQDPSNPLVTAYALIGLVEADRQGFNVDDAVIQNAIGFVDDSLVTITTETSNWRVNRQVFLLYALARAGAANEGRVNTVYEERARLPIYGQALLAMTLHLIDANDSRIDTLLGDIGGQAILSAAGAHWEEAYADSYNWNTNTRTTALVLDAFTLINPTNPLIPNIVRWLMIARDADAWETTQETAWAVMALTDWMVASGELAPDYSYTTALNGETLVEETVTPDNVRDGEQLVVQVSELLADEANRLVFERSEGEGALYYTAYLNTSLPVSEVEAANRGIILSREYTLAGDEGGTPITQARVGDNVQVRLTIIVPNNLHYVVIEDPIPAGTDAVNPNLLTSQQIGTAPTFEETSNPLSYGWGWWYFSNIEFRDEMVALYATYLPAGTYEFVYTLRAGLPGVYNVIPATGQEFYFPEVYGRSSGNAFTILGAGE
jgi:hypothetical protein